MDTELLKTFLEVERTRHFGRAAENLYLTQAAISSRIRQLENTLGVSLFNRHRNNINLTPAGERLKPHAEAIMTSWSRALQESALGSDQSLQIALGGATYLPQSIAAPYIEDGQLFLLPESPHIDRKVFTAYLKNSEKKETLEQIIALFGSIEPELNASG